MARDIVKQRSQDRPMRAPRRLAWAALVSAVALAGAVAARAQSTKPSMDAHARIQAAADAAFAEWLKDDPMLALAQGEGAVRLPDRSPSALAARALRAADIERSIEGINAANLPLEDAILLDKVRWSIGHARAQAAIAPFVFPVGGYTGPVLSNPEVFTNHPLRRKADRDAYLDLLKDAGRLISEMSLGLETRAARGAPIPAACLADSAADWDRFIAASTPSKSALVPDARRLRPLGPVTVRRFLADATRIVEEEIYPAAARYVAFAHGPFMQKAAPRLGMAQYTGGSDAYTLALRDALTVNTSAKAVNALGYAILETLREPREALFKELGYEGGIEGFNAFVRSTRPDLISRTRRDAGKRITGYIGEVLPKLKEYFLFRPTTPFAAEPLPEALESSITYGRYHPPAGKNSPGVYAYNGAPDRPMIGVATLAWHEGIPGHHYQYDLLTARGRNLPPLLKEATAPFFYEGWATYAAAMAGKMGLNRNAIDRYDQLQDEALMSVRLIVDTGLNGLEMTDSEALRLLREEAGLTDAEARSELARYACQVPGQALGYEYGRLAIGAARVRAQQALGPLFDLREFHEAILRYGDLSRDSLDLVVDDLIARGGKSREDPKPPVRRRARPRPGPEAGR